ncbi:MULTISPECIES: methyl-accepting chemotaxis protein [Halomonadaceae]|uniref:Methyl-accepting chemotaxis sensory transducer with Cache sensor n=1 Tax=Onishia taeanensis TaxID=284577 RepID=A0A328XYM0_9GAMM|nr:MULTISPECIES: methyl-accepting chemotaxis protein [Halomonas]RAR60957.1 methyl-accepting chemotaxis sensory transducer with Cache sensor [Halomonas taeanensis]
MTTQHSRPSRWNLQTKVMTLVLVPLLLITLTLVGMSTYQRIQSSHDNLAQQREELLKGRQEAVKDVVLAAKSAIAPIYDKAGPNDEDAKARAAEILRSIRFDGDNYIFVFRYDGTTVAHINRDLEGKNLIDLQGPDGGYMIRTLIENAKAGGGFHEYPWPHPTTKQEEDKYSYSVGLDKWGWMLGAGVYAVDVEEAMADAQATANDNLRNSIISSLLMALALFIGVALVAGWVVKRTLQPIRSAAQTMSNIASGKGDLTQRLNVSTHDEVGQLAEGFNLFVSRMQDTLREVRSTTSHVRDAASDMEQSSQELATRTEQAAANLQQTSSSMEEITSTVDHSAQSAQQANQLVLGTGEVARRGESAMQDVERTMADINDSSSKVSDIVTMIDSIAFQTNILALNASVEAARAGEHGRGFAVVAEEVRTLAQRSSDASKEIRALIDTSAAHTESGAKLVRDAGTTMQEIAASVAKVTDVIGEITAGAKEQSSGIGQVNTAVTEMDTMTQQNAAMVQQSTTTASKMRDQAEQLQRLLGSFELGDDNAQPLPRGEEKAPSLPSASGASSHASATTRPKSAVRNEEEWEAF